MECLFTPQTTVLDALCWARSTWRLLSTSGRVVVVVVVVEGSGGRRSAQAQRGTGGVSCACRGCVDGSRAVLGLCSRRKGAKADERVRRRRERGERRSHAISLSPARSLPSHRRGFLRPSRGFKIVVATPQNGPITRRWDSDETHGQPIASVSSVCLRGSPPVSSRWGRR